MGDRSSQGDRLDALHNALVTPHFDIKEDQSLQIITPPVRNALSQTG